MTPSMSFALSAFTASSTRCRMRASAMASSFDFTNRELSSRHDEVPPVDHESGQNEQYRGHGDVAVLRTPEVRNGGSYHSQHQPRGGQRGEGGHDPRQLRHHDPDRPQ